ncbi:FAD-binding oxidoreductase [Actinoplanes regularis]|uniref:FAD/FMN-containing dehydrogenase n=1 Tax=Actinoplanes regularis TaxID=52697 RepID=A0A239JDB9_9ACTN|nr:FAD-binding oxidoreductase [Actinoplanes regularis]GIE91820.1 FAD-linked oxidase [Actinoplanes regularis]SNT03901.1 FAD/FMN-containing dehydrogenase [Actinoplanes regularis]
MAGEATIRKDDARYPGLISGANTRWVGAPEYVRLVSSAAEVAEAVQDAVDQGLKVTVRSGGHCDENFTTSTDVQVVINLAGLNAVYYDEERRAFAVEPGAMLGHVYETLYRGWGVTIPGGTCPTVGAGGHIVGGGYGALSRLHGLTVDYLYAVEIVVVDENGRCRTVVATSEPDDPHRELWWAHTGAGGGNFGVITTYWLRSPDSASAEPADQLPAAPAEVLVSDIAWSWSDLTEESFTRLVRNFSAWHEANSAPDSPWTGLYSQLKTQHKAAGMFRMSTQIDASVPDAQGRLDRFLAAVNEGTGVDYSVNDRSVLPWFYVVREWFGFVEPSLPRWKAKSAYMRKAMPADQLAALYRQLTRDDYDNPFSMVALVSYGGRINTVDPEATAVAQRDSVLKLLYVTLWTDKTEDDRHDRWIRECYADVYAASGGVPSSNAVTDGCFINYADADVADPALNDSGVPWHELYFKNNYSRLQAVKERWDPRGEFSHALSIRPTPERLG